MKILVTGDYVPVGRIAEQVKAGNFGCYELVKPIVSSVDYSVVNLECPVVESHAQPIQKVGPNLKCTSKGIDAIKWAGFSCVTLANNHLNDYGSIGIRDTINVLKEKGIDYVGAGENIEEASKILYKRIGSEIIGIINCCEHEFSIASTNAAGSNPLNPIQQYYSIKEAKANADYVLVIVHGGHEHFQLPSPRMQETYRFFIDAGADAVVNHHQHCYSGYEVYREKPIFYGLGNFCFDKIFANTPSTWYEGYMVLLEFESGKVHFTLFPYWQCKEKAEVTLLEDLEDGNFLKKVESLSNIIADPVLLNLHFAEFCDKRKDIMIIDSMAPVGNKLMLAAARRHLFPSFVSHNRLLRVINLIRCESHYDLLMKSLKKRLNK